MIKIERRGRAPMKGARDGGVISYSRCSPPTVNQDLLSKLRNKGKELHVCRIMLHHSGKILHWQMARVY